MSHLKIIVDILAVMLGTGAAVLLIRSHAPRHGPALRALGLYVVFHNLLVLAELGNRYYLVNIIGSDFSLYSASVMTGLLALRITADCGYSWFLFVASRRFVGSRPSRALLVLLLASGALVFGLSIREIHRYELASSITTLVVLLEIWILAILAVVVAILVLALRSSRTLTSVHERRSLRRLSTLLLLAYGFILAEALNFYFLEMGGFDPGNFPILGVDLAVLAWMRFWPPTSWTRSTEIRAGSLEQLRQDFGISPREGEVIEQLLAGKSNKEIQKALFISPSTVKNHLTSIYRKLGVDSRARLIALLRFRRDRET